MLLAFFREQIADEKKNENPEKEKLVGSNNKIRWPATWDLPQFACFSKKGIIISKHKLLRHSFLSAAGINYLFVLRRKETFDNQISPHRDAISTLPLGAGHELHGFAWPLRGFRMLKRV